jgi:glutathione peroxidase
MRKKYKAEYLIMEKIHVNGPETHPVWSFLRRNSKDLWNETKGEAKVIPWSWSSFIIDGQGKVIKFNRAFHESPKSCKKLIGRLTAEVDL